MGLGDSSDVFTSDGIITRRIDDVTERGEHSKGGDGIWCRGNSKESLFVGQGFKRFGIKRFFPSLWRGSGVDKVKSVEGEGDINKVSKGASCGDGILQRMGNRKAEF